MLIQNICTVFFFEDATALVKMDNTTLLNKKIFVNFIVAKTPFRKGQNILLGKYVIPPFRHVILFHCLIFYSFWSCTSRWPYDRPPLGPS